MFDNPKKYYSRSRLKIMPDIITGRETIVVLITVTLLFGLLIWWLNHIPYMQRIWENFIVDKKIPASFCEQVDVNNPVRQPVNTFSNIIYLITAIIILKTTRNERYINRSDGHLAGSNRSSTLFSFILL